jgi:serine/threonine protein kinase
MELTSSPRTRVGKYELGNTLGEGTFAKVKIAKNKETGESVAIKVIDKEKILKHKMVDQVARPTWISISLCFSENGFHPGMLWIQSGQDQECL